MATVISRGVCECVKEKWQESVREKKQLKLCPTRVLYKPITKSVIQLQHISLTFENRQTKGNTSELL